MSCDASSVGSCVCGARNIRFGWTLVVLAAACIGASPDRAMALIEGGTGNDPVKTAGWPAGAAEVFNAPERIAYWVGPPFGGGQWHGEFRGDTDAFNRALEVFARIDVKLKRLVVHNGVGNSVWLNINREKEKEAQARIDWVFMVWEHDSWQRLQQLPADLRPRDGDESDESAATQIDVYTGGNIEWADVKVPEGIEVIDERLEAHGFHPDDGKVLEGTVVDLVTEEPLPAEMHLQLVEPQQRGGYKYTTVAEVSTDATGRWVLKSAPAGWHRVVVHSDGYVARVVGYGQFDDQPTWSEYNTGLARPATVSGQVSDAAGQPLADVDVRFRDVVAVPGGRYETLTESGLVRTDREGRFFAEGLPVGRTSVQVYKPGYCRPGLGLNIDIPAERIDLTMVRSATIEVTVDFSDTERPGGYIVEIEPEGGSAVGLWGGSGNIDAAGKIKFENIPPGRYVLTGRPNPGREDQQTEPILIDLSGGEELVARLRAKLD